MEAKITTLIISIILAVTMIASMTVAAFADSSGVEGDFKVGSNAIMIASIAENDLIVDNTVIDDGQNEIPNSIILKANPDQPVGSTKTISVYVTNETMGLPSLAGQGLSLAARKKAAKKVAAVVASKIGTKLLAGLDIASFVLACYAMKNAKTGNKGILVKAYFKYKKVYNNKEGHYNYGWDIIKVTVSPY